MYSMMNLLSRAIIAQKLLHSPHHPSRRCHFSPQSITVFQHFSLFSTTNYQATNTKLKTQQPRKPRTQKPSSESSSSYRSWPQRVKEQAEKLPKWPKPSEIPYQPKVANSVNLIGVIQMPIQFHATPDGKHLAATFIAQGNGTNSGLSVESSTGASLSSYSLMIPLVFEGDLAHIVACHVKQNDCVYVTGKLCVEKLPFVLNENQGKCHVLGQEINFVQGFEQKVPMSGTKDLGKVVDAKSRLDSVENENGEKGDVGDGLLSLKSNNTVNKLWEDAVAKRNESKPSWVHKKLESLKFENKVDQKRLDRNETFKDESYNDEISLKNVGMTNDGNYSWRDLVRNPKDWWDNRQSKSKGLKKPNYPDFKHKTNDTALWLNNAPNWALPGLQGLEFDVQVHKEKPANGGKRASDVQVHKEKPASGGKRASGGKDDDRWKSLVENPDKWWDNRLGKLNERGPDFKNKETGEGLWLESSPEWVLSRLPPLKGDQTRAAGPKSTICTASYSGRKKF